MKLLHHLHSNLFIQSFHVVLNAIACVSGAIFLDSSLEECDRVLAQVLFSKDGADVLSAWTHFFPHPLKVSEGAARVCVIKHHTISLKSDVSTCVCILIHVMRGSERERERVNMCTKLL